MEPEEIQEPQVEEGAETQELSLEDRAKLHGWSPEEDWRGDPDNWVDAKTFLKKMEQRPAIARERFEAMEKRLARMERANEGVTQFYQSAMSRMAQQHQAQMNQLKQQLRQAATDGDMDRFDQIETQMMQLEANPPQQGAMPPGIPNEVAEWVADGNEWYLESTKLADEAKNLGDRLAIARPNLRGRAQLDEISRIIKKNYPDLFGGTPSKPPRKATAVHGGDDVRPPTGEGKRSYAALPADAKKLCDEFVQMIPGFTRDQFVKDFDWGD